MERFGLRLTNLAFDLNHAVDAGRQGTLPLEEVKAHIVAGTIFPYLEKALGADLDISLFYADDRAELTREWQQFLEVADEGRKFGVRHNGLCLIQAYVIEGIQRRMPGSVT